MFVTITHNHKRIPDAYIWFVIAAVWTRDHGHSDDIRSARGYTYLSKGDFYRHQQSALTSLATIKGG